MVKDISERLLALEAQLQGFRAEVLRWQLAHIRYHNQYEANWGLVSQMSRHPIRTLLAGLVFGIWFAGNVANSDLLTWLAALWR